MKRTALYDQHLAAGARMVDFGGWEMPVAYGSQIEEHHAVRRSAGMFDVSHMCTVDLRGNGVRALLLRLLANDVVRLTAPDDTVRRRRKSGITVATPSPLRSAVRASVGRSSSN